MADDQENRRQQRICLAMPARFKNAAGQCDHVTVVDLSNYGCRIALIELDFTKGQAVAFRLDRLGVAKGWIRWVSGHSAGVEFEQPLYEPVVHHLHRSWPMPKMFGARPWLSGSGGLVSTNCPAHFRHIIEQAKQIEEQGAVESIARLTNSAALGYRLRYV